MKTAALIIALLLSGCGGKYMYVKPGKTIAEARQNSGECEYEANVATATIYNSMTKAMETYRIKDMCMNTRGYYRVNIK